MARSKLEQVSELVTQLVMLTDGRDPLIVAHAVRDLVHREGSYDIVKHEQLIQLRHQAYKFKTMNEQIFGALTTLSNTIDDFHTEIGKCKLTVENLKRVITHNMDKVP